MPTSVALTPHLESLTKRLVASGRYNNVSEVIRDSLRLLETKMKIDDAKLVALRDAAQQGFAAIERGEFLTLESDKDIELFVRQAGVKAKASVSTAQKIG